MMAAQEEGWEPVGNVCFRDHRGEPDDRELQSPVSATAAEFIAAPPPQFDNSQPDSIETPLNNTSNKSETFITLDDEILTLEREVLGEEIKEDVEMIIAPSVVKSTKKLEEVYYEEVGKPNQHYVYGEEGAQKKPYSQQNLKDSRRSDPNRIPTVKGSMTPAQIKENVIEAEIRAQQQRERELQFEQIKKNQVLQQNLQNVQKNDIMRKKGASSPHDSDEGFVDPHMEKSSNQSTDVSQSNMIESPSNSVDGSSPAGYTHAVTDANGDTAIYDAVSPVTLSRPSSRNNIPSKSPAVSVKSATSTTATTVSSPILASHTTETKIALEIRELKEREEELRKMRDARLAAKKIQHGGGGLQNGGAQEDVEEEEFAEEDMDDVEGGSSSSREMLDDHLASLTTTTDEGNFSECGDATSSEDKSSNGSNSRIMSPEVPPSDYSRPPRRVTVRPYQGDLEDDQPVYTRMKNESVIEREIRMAKEREEAYKREKGTIVNNSNNNNSTSNSNSNNNNNNSTSNNNNSNNSTSNNSNNNSTSNNNNINNNTNSTDGIKHVPLRQTASLSSIQNGKEPQTQSATIRIQQEIMEDGHRERELIAVGKVLTLSEDAADDKVPRISDISDLAIHQEKSNKSPTSTSSRGSSSSRQSPSLSPQSTLSSSRSSSQNGFVTNGFITNGGAAHHFSNGFSSSGSSSVARLTRSLSTTNLSSTSSSPSSLSNSRAPKGFMEKFIASRGKMTPSAFSSPPPAGAGRIVVTRPMRLQPKTPVVLRQKQETNTEEKVSAAVDFKTNMADVKAECTTKSSATKQPAAYKRVIGAEEKIQEELREMQQREEELRQVRTRSMARSQPNLLEMGLCEVAFDDDVASEADSNSQAGVVESSTGSVEGEVTLRAAVSNPNLLEDAETTKAIKKLRRRSTLIAEWENRIQATTTIADV